MHENRYTNTPPQRQSHRNTATHRQTHRHAKTQAHQHKNTQTHSRTNTTNAPTQKTVTEDENLNKVTPPKTAAPTQSPQDKESENEMLKRQLAEITKQAEAFAHLNNQFRQRNATLEEQMKDKTKQWS